MSKVNLKISIEDEQLPRFRELVDQIKNLGLDVDQELEPLGIVIGRIDRGGVSALKRLRGVAHVEESRTIQIPPPESDVQ
jgi:hypothetical protein